MSQNDEIVTVGDDVQLTKDLFGMVKFVGEIQQRKGVYYGIELKEAKGKTNGTIQNIRYFKCKINRGLFVRRSRITRVCHKRNASLLYRIGINESIKLTMKGTKKVTGNVRYIGRPQKSIANEIYYGVKFTNPIGNCNGLYQGIRYFNTKKNYAYFIKANSKRIIYATNNQYMHSTISSSSASASSSSSTTTTTESDSDSDSDSESKDDELRIMEYHKYYKNREKTLQHGMNNSGHNNYSGTPSKSLSNDWMINALNADTFKKRYQCTRSLMEKVCGNSNKIPQTFNINGTSKILHLFAEWLENEKHFVVRKHILQLLVPLANGMNSMNNMNSSIIKQIAKSLITRQWLERRRGFLALVGPALISIYIGSNNMCDISEWKEWLLSALLSPNIETQTECWDFLAHVMELSVLRKKLCGLEWIYNDIMKLVKDEEILSIAKNVLLKNKDNNLRLRCCLFIYGIVHCFKKNNKKYQSVYKQLLQSNEISLYFYGIVQSEYNNIFIPFHNDNYNENENESENKNENESAENDDQSVKCINCMKKEKKINQLCDEMKGLKEVISGLKIEKNGFKKNKREWIINLEKAKKIYSERLNNKKNMELELFELRKELSQLKKINNNHYKNDLIEWTSNDILEYVVSLDNGRYLKYEENINTLIQENNINGNELIRNGNFNERDLRKCGINRFLDRKQLVTHINELINHYKKEEVGDNRDRAPSESVLSEQLEGAIKENNDSDENSDSDLNSVIIHEDVVNNVDVDADADEDKDADEKVMEIYENIEVDLVIGADEKVMEMECNQCFQLKKESDGYADDEDGSWYCLQCWNEFNAQQENINNQLLDILMNDDGNVDGNDIIAAKRKSRKSILDSYDLTKLIQEKESESQSVDVENEKKEDINDNIEEDEDGDEDDSYTDTIEENKSDIIDNKKYLNISVNDQANDMLLDPGSPQILLTMSPESRLQIDCNADSDFDDITL